MRACSCNEPHVLRRIVITGGPGAGKTAVLELVRQALCQHVRVLPEAAGIIFGGGFPREPSKQVRRAAQRAIFYVQRELELAAESHGAAIVLCDRGTVDGAAYWLGPETLWEAVGTTLDAQLGRYDAVIHLRTPRDDGGYNQQNPLRIESALEAAAIDDRIATAWRPHPQRFEVAASPSFLTKATRSLAIVRALMPPCCRSPGAIAELEGLDAVNAPIDGA